MIGQSAQRVVKTADQRPAKALRDDGVAEDFLRIAQPAGLPLDLEEQNAATADHDQIGKTGMDAHADQDRLTLCPAWPGFGHLIGAMMNDGISGQGEAQGLEDGALGIRLGGAAAVHRAALPGSS